MALPGTLLLCLPCLLLCSAAPKPRCDPGRCPPCPDGDREGTASPAAGGCCPCPPHLLGECQMQGFSSIPAGRSFYIDFARSLCTCQPSGAVSCASRCPRPPPGCRALGSPLADGCPRCVCYRRDGLPVPAGSVTARGSQSCTCPALGGQLLCSADGGER